MELYFGQRQEDSLQGLDQAEDNIFYLDAFFSNSLLTQAYYRAENVLENNALAYKVIYNIEKSIFKFFNALTFTNQVAEDSLGIPSLLDPEVKASSKISPLCSSGIAIF